MHLRVQVWFAASYWVLQSSRFPFACILAAQHVFMSVHKSACLWLRVQVWFAASYWVLQSSRFPEVKILADKVRLAYVQADVRECVCVTACDYVTVTVCECV